MQEAVSLGAEGMQEKGGGPFGAVIVRDGKLVGRGWNQVTRNLDPTAHAEVIAIRDACELLQRFDLRGCEIYTSCEPCPMCLAAIYWARIGKVFYAATRGDAAAAGFDDELLYRELALSLERRKLPLQQLLRSEAQTIFQEWIVKPDKTPY
jgi:guanine deaminase